MPAGSGYCGRSPPAARSPPRPRRSRSRSRRSASRSLPSSARRAPRSSSVACDRCVSPTPAARSWCTPRRCSPTWTRAQQELGEIAGLRRGRPAACQLPHRHRHARPSCRRAVHPAAPRRRPDRGRRPPAGADREAGTLGAGSCPHLRSRGATRARGAPGPDPPAGRPIDLLVADGHPLARRRSIALEELADETLIGGTPDGAYARIVLHSCRVAGFEPRVVFGSDDYNAVQAFVAVGLGVAILPRLALTFPRPGLAASPWPTPRYGESPQSGWRPASGPQRRCRCSAYSRKPRLPSARSAAPTPDRRPALDKPASTAACSSASAGPSSLPVTHHKLNGSAGRDLAEALRTITADITSGNHGNKVGPPGRNL